MSIPNNLFSNISMRIFRIWLFFLAAMLVLFSSVSYAQGTLTTIDSPLSRTPLKVGVLDNLRPYSFVDRNGETSGVIIDLWKEWSIETGIPIQFVTGDYRSLQRALLHKTIDINAIYLGRAGDATKTSVGRPYYGLSSGMFARDGTLSHGSDMTVAIAQGAETTSKVKSLIGKSLYHFVNYADNNAAIAAAMNGEVDAVYTLSAAYTNAIMNSVSGMGKLNPVPSMQHNIYIRPVVRIDEHTKLKFINNGFDTIKRSTLANIEAKWLPRRLDRYYALRRFSIHFDNDERAFILKHPTIRVGFPVDNYEPFYFREKGQLVGIDLQVLGLVEERSGLKFIPVPIRSWKEALKELEEGRVDVLTSSYSSPERKQSILFTNSYFTLNNALVTRVEDSIGSVSNLAGKLVAVPEGWREGELLKEIVPGVDIVYTRNAKDALQMVSDGRVFAFIGSTINSSYIIEEYGFANLKIATPVNLTDSSIKMGVNKNYPELQTILNKTLSSISTQEMMGFKNRWFKVQFDYGIKPQSFFRYLGFAGLIIAGIFVGVFAWNQRLRYEVQARLQVEKELIAAREAAEQAAHAKSNFLASMSHEMRTPLNGIMGMIEVMSYGDLSSSQRENIEIIHSSSSSLLNLINDVLDFSKINADKLDIEWVGSNLPLLAENVIKTLQSNASQKQLTLELEVVGEFDCGHFVDPARLRQVLFNLIGNAIKFTPEGGVTVRLSRSSDELDNITIEVIDTGIGIEKEKLTTIFEPFEQAERSTSRRFGGTGLGLSISRKIVEILGGTLELLPNESVGTTAKVSLSLRSCALEAVIIEKTLYESHITPVSFNRSVLLVEDHPTNQKVMLAQLELLGIQADKAENGLEALKLIKSNKHYDLVLSDCHMPIMDGYELIKHIRQLERDEVIDPVLVVAVTANVMDGERQKCLDLGFNEFISKPFKLNHLKRMIDNVSISGNLTEAIQSSQEGETEELPSIDFSILYGMVGDQVFAEKILQEFIDTSINDLEKLKEAYDQQDLESIRQLSHRIKGTARMVGGVNLGECAADVEQMARDGEIDEILVNNLFLSFKYFHEYSAKEFGWSTNVSISLH